jgi:hypothetical protein
MLMGSANRFSILASLSPSSETKWAFDFVPTSRLGTRRRGKRGGRQHRLKHAFRKKCEKPEADGVDELCDRYAALHLDDDAPGAISLETDRAPPSGVLSDVNAVRHHWAPQFRPDSLPTSNSTLAHPTSKCLSQKSALDQGSSVDVRSSTRKLSPKFPLSAFLKVLASPNDCAGHWPPRNPTPQPAPSPQTPQDPDQQPARLLLTSAHPAGNCSPNDQGSNTTSSQSNAIESQRTVPTTSSLSTNALPTYKHWEAFGVPPFTQMSELDSPASRSPSPPPSKVPPVRSSSLYPRLSPIPMSAMLTTTAPSSQRSPRSWQEALEGIAVFHPSPAAFITAPVTSPYPFVYPPQPWTPSAVPSGLFKDTAAVPMRLRSKFAFTPDPPGRRVTQEEFLTMGHDPECWCDRHKKARQARDLADKAGASGRALAFDSSEFSHQWGNPNAAEPQAAPTVPQPSHSPRPLGSGPTIEEFIASMRVKSGASSPHPEMSNLRALNVPAAADTTPGASPASSPIATPGGTYAPYTAPEVEDNTESAPSDEDVVMITPTSEGTDFGFQRLMTPSPDARFDFEGLEVIEGVPVDSDNDWPDDDWTSVSDRLYSQRPSSSQTTHFVSDASVQTSMPPMIVSLPPVTLLSPPQTPPTRVYQAHVSDVGSGSETD